MIRLFWKEAREQMWFAIAGLLLPCALLWHLRATDPTRPVWPDRSSDLFLLAVFFAVWGASRLAHERQAGQLTLGSLPIRSWQIWIAKVLPAMLVCFVGVLLALHLGLATSRDPLDEGSRQLWFGIASGGVFLAFATAFAISDGFHPAIGAVLGGAIAVMGIDAACMGVPSSAATSAIWAAALVTAAIPVLSHVGRSNRLFLSRVFTIVVCAAVSRSQIVLPARGTGAFILSLIVNSESPIPPNSLVSRSTGRVAILKVGFPNHDTEWDELFVARLDGSGRRRVAQASHIVPLEWTPNGRLLFEEELDKPEHVRWVLWDPAVGSSPIARFRFPEMDLKSPYTPTVVTAPNDRWIAYLRPPQKTLAPLAGLVDLCVLDTVSGQQRLVLPAVGSASLSWNAGRIVVDRDHGSRFSIAPTGGSPRKERRSEMTGGR